MRKADNLPPSRGVVKKSGNLKCLQSSGPLQACNGTALPLFLSDFNETRILLTVLRKIRKWSRKQLAICQTFSCLSRPCYICNLIQLPFQQMLSSRLMQLEYISTQLIHTVLKKNTTHI